MQVNFGPTAVDYVQHRAGFPAAFFARLEQRGIFFAGRAALDIGAGTGAVAHALAQRGARVIACDVSPEMVAAGEALSRRHRLPVSWRVCPAEQTGLLAGSVELLTAGQCWHWFDRPRAAAECRRVLAPGGWIVIAHLDWKESAPVVGSSVRLAEALGGEYPPQLALGQHGLYPAWLSDLEGAGFFGLETGSFDCSIPYSGEAWRGRMRASALFRSLGEGARAEFDARLAALLPREGVIEVPHRVFWVLGRAPS